MVHKSHAWYIKHGISHNAFGAHKNAPTGRCGGIFRSIYLLVKGAQPAWAQAHGEEPRLAATFSATAICCALLARSARGA